MNCEMFRELIFDYVGGTLDADSLADFRRHYDGCTPCEATVRTIEAQETLLTSLPRPKAPDALWGRIQAEIADRDMLRRAEETPRFRFGGWIAAAAALVIALGTVFAIARGPSTSEPDTPMRVVDITSQPAASTLGLKAPGYENPRPGVPLAELMGMK